MEEILNYFQLGANAFALLIAGWIYTAYIRNLKSASAVKSEQIALLEKNVGLWKDRAEAFEKQTPGYLEEVLATRIRHREDEIARLAQDRDQHTRLLKARSAELGRLKAELEKSRRISRAITYYDLKRDAEVIIPDTELELEEIGEVFVDSGSLMVTDPCYINGEWRNDVKFEDIRVYKHIRTDKMYQYQRDFAHYDDELPALGGTVNELVKKGELIPLELQREFTYSYAGSAYASLSKKGYGTLRFPNGHDGAGICVRTAYGDGVYPVYGERFQGRIVRIYIDLQ